MYLLLQFPLADSRIFLPHTQTRQLPVPEWPSPTPDVEFVRFFGGVKIRKRGGLEVLGGEDTICEAKRALRFAQSPIYDDGDSDLKVQFRTYRRFYFDGYVVGKFEVSLANLKPYRVDSFNLSKKQTREIVNYFLGLNVHVRDAQNPADMKMVNLAHIGSHLAQLYAAASSSLESPQAVEPWWVRPGTPLLFLEYNKLRENLQLPYWIKPMTLPEDYGLQLAYCLVPYQGQNIRMWILGLNSGAVDLNKARSLRLCLLRLHAEHECLRLILNNIKRKRIVVTPRTELSDILQRYLQNATKAIRRLESKSTNSFDMEIVEIARQSINSMTPGDHEEILRTLEQFDIRKNLLRNLQEYIQRDIQSVTVVGDVTIDNRTIHAGRDYFEHIEGNTRVTTGDH
jgi:hypothetical protein